MGFGFGLDPLFALADAGNFVIRCFVFVISQISPRLRVRVPSLTLREKFLPSYFSRRAVMFKCLASFLVLSTGMCLGQSFVGSDMAPGPTTEPKKPIIFDLSAIDKTADPCVGLLSVRLRKLGQEQSRSVGPVALGTVQRTGGEKQLSAVPGTEGRSRRSEDSAAEEVWRLLCGVHERWSWQTSWARSRLSQ